MVDWSSNTFTNLLAAISLIVSIPTAIFYFRDRRNARFQIENEYIRSILEWHGAVVDILLRLRHSKSILSETERSNDLARLSALIEQGRFFFPNIDKGDAFGDEKPPAYRGYRNLALDLLVASFNLFNGSTNADTKNQSETLQRHFTSIVYEIVRPHSRLETIKALTDRYFAQKKSFEDFLDHNDATTIEHIWRKP